MTIRPERDHSPIRSNNPARTPRRERPRGTGATALSGLDNLTLSRKEGWQQRAYAPARIPPEPLTRKQIRTLGEKARRCYNRQRRIWHANLPTIKTEPLKEIQKAVELVIDSNMQDGDKAKGCVGIEGPPAIGKSIAIQDLAFNYHRREIDELGEYVGDNERWPVCRVGMTGNTDMRAFNRAMLNFYNHAGAKTGTATDFARRALDCVLSCQTRLLIVDDLHFLKVRTTSQEISNQFKYISNEFPLTIVFIGIGLRQRGLYSDGEYAGDVLGQSGRRITGLTMREFSIDDEPGRWEWRRLLLSIEKRIVVADKEHGMLADDLSDYLWERSSGRIGSLMALITRACHLAITSGREVINQALLEGIRNDEASEQKRPELHAGFAAGRLTSKPKGYRRKT
nr:TniB family NTP-binding protein [Mycobacterium sp. MOTT36Y]